MILARSRPVETLSITLPRTFFITGLGRSGTKYLSKLLNRSEQYEIVHEKVLDGKVLRFHRQFPLYRFAYNTNFRNRNLGYGEVNSHLRYSLNTQKTGLEAMIEKKAIIFRNPKDVISSALNRRSRTIDDFESICMRNLRNYNKLLGLMRHPSQKYEKFFFEEVTNSVKAINDLAEWVGIEDLCFTQEEMKKKVNVNKTTWFPKWKRWEKELKDFYIRKYDEVVTFRTECFFGQ